MSDYAHLYQSIHELVMCHSPSGVEGEIDTLLMERFQALDVPVVRDAADNIIARIPGAGRGRIAITAHKDEIGAIVTKIEDGGRVRVRKLGGSYPWVYGEGVVDLLGDERCVTGVLSFGSRHVSQASPQFALKESAPVRWTDAWVETKLSTAQLAQSGVRPGTRMVIGKHRKAPLRLNDHIASYTLDNKASLAVLLELAKRVKKPRPEVWLVATAKEEVGAIGGLYFTKRQDVDALIALEVCPLAPEYSVQDGVAPVLLAEDSHGLYDDALNRAVLRMAIERSIPLQVAAISGFGSDGSLSLKQGHVPRAACLGFPTQNTHGYEIAHLGAIQNCVEILEAVCGADLECI